jgi:hypothetical protein
LDGASNDLDASEPADPTRKSDARSDAPNSQQSQKDGHGASDASDQVQKRDPHSEGVYPRGARARRGRATNGGGGQP